jgi:ribulose-5-phosphate 4-epimerase/fuculose-1-phosphate aldolase
MPTADDIVAQLVLANRILANEDVFDSFGHVTVRHPDNPNHFLMARSRSPDQVEAADIIAFTLESQPVDPAIKVPFGERVIHGSIYAARPDVNAVCHHHGRAVLPFCISGVELKPVDHVGACMGATVPFWDQRDEFGDTDMIVGKPEEGASLARALGPHWVVLMRRHGATVAGRSLPELVYRAIHSCRNAELQQQALALGRIGAMTPGEIEKAGAFNLTERPVMRAWDYWVRRARKADA